jgi:DinB superfamily
MPRPDSSEFAEPYRAYVALATEDEILPALRAQLVHEFAPLKTIPEAEFSRRHPPYTWSIKQVVGHLIDAERIFGCRALRFARGDATPVPGFDENPYAISVILTGARRLTCCPSLRSSGTPTSSSSQISRLTPGTDEVSPAATR